MSARAGNASVNEDHDMDDADGGGGGGGGGGDGSDGGDVEMGHDHEVVDLDHDSHNDAHGATAAEEDVRLPYKGFVPKLPYSSEPPGQGNPPRQLVWIVSPHTREIDRKVMCLLGELTGVWRDGTSW